MNPVLLPLSPIGIGSIHVESFASYLARLARLHHCSVSQVARFVASWESTHSGRDYKLEYLPIYPTHGSGLNGFAERVRTYVDVMKRATRQADLHRCTLLALCPTLTDKSRNSVRPFRAWCEQCFREDSGNETGPYGRLLWTLAIIERCPHHRVRLRTECPSCANKQRFYHRFGDPGICFTCGASLIGSPSQLHPALQSTLGERDAGEMVESISSGELEKAHKNALRVFEATLRSILSPVAAIVGDIAEISGSAHKRRVETKPTLRTMFRKAQAAGVPLVRILQDPKAAAHAAGQLMFDKHMIGATARARHPSGVRKEAELALKTHLQNSETVPMPRLEEVADACGVSPGYLRYHLPKLVKTYQLRRISALSHKKISDAADCIRYLKLDFRSATRKVLARKMAAEIGCSINTAARAIRKVLGNA